MADILPFRVKQKQSELERLAMLALDSIRLHDAIRARLVADFLPIITAHMVIPPALLQLPGVPDEYTHVISTSVSHEILKRHMQFLGDLIALQITVCELREQIEQQANNKK